MSTVHPSALAEPDLAPGDPARADGVSSPDDAEREQTPQERSERLAFRRGVSLLVLTLLVPGSAQVIAGGKGLGRFAMRLWLGVLGVLGLFALLFALHRNAAIAVYAHPFTQWLGSSVVLVLGIGWALLLLDAWRLSRPGLMGRPRTYWMAALAGVLALGLAAGATQVSALGRSQATLFGSVFAGGGFTAPTDGRINVLLIGADAEPDRPGIRTDTMMVASVSATTGRTVLFSLPRNLQWAPFPADSPLRELYPKGYWCEDQSCLLNAVYNLAEQHPDLYPGAERPGLVALREVVSEILGLRINYHAMIDMTGFEQLIDAMGGVTLDIAKAVPIGGGSAPVEGYIQPGENVRLGGFEALWFARSRHGASDYERMARQKCIVNAVAKQATPTTLITRFNELAAAGASVLTTDVPTSEIGRLVELADAGRRLPIASVSFAPPLIEPVKPDFAVITDTVDEQIRASVAADEDAARAAAQAAAAEQAGDEQADTAQAGAAPAQAAPAEGAPAQAAPTEAAPQGEPAAATEPTEVVVADAGPSGTGGFSEERQTDDLTAICSVD
ncbi:LCP family protein [Propioniciclava soli]|uniref:LCP family protein n=1 Tax=Propioniciclava soli TaxID=2775081 RepID=UPI001E4F8772